MSGDKHARHRWSRRSVMLAGGALAAVAGMAEAVGRRPLRGNTAAVSPADYTVANFSQLQTVLALGAATLSGKIVEFLDGGTAEYGTAPIYCTTTGLSGGTPLIPTSTLIFRSRNHRGAQLPGFQCNNTNHITLIGLKFVLLQADATPVGVGDVVCYRGASNFAISDCEVSSDPYLTSFDPTGYVQVSNVVGTFTHGEQLVTNVAGSGNSGYYDAHRPHSSLSQMAVRAMDGSPVGGGANDYSTYWYTSGAPTSRFITGQTSGATATTGPNKTYLGFLVGVGGGSGTAAKATNVVVMDCYIHDVQNGVAGIGINIAMLRCTVDGYFDAPFAMNGDCPNLNIKDNRAINNWSHNTDGQPVGTNGPHASTGGLSFGDNNSTGVNIEGNVLLVGLARYNFDGQKGVVSGPKFNGQAASLTAYVDTGNVLHVPNAVSGWTIRVGHRLLRRNGDGLVPQGTKIVGLGTGTGGAGSYILSNSMADIGSVGTPSTQFELQSRVTATIRANLTDTNLNIGWAWAYLADSECAYNTMITSRDTQDLASMATIYFNNNDRTRIHHNISISTALGSVDRDDNDTAELQASIENVQLSMNGTTGSGSFEASFVGAGGGNPFGGVSLANALTMFATKVAGPLDGRGVGHAAYYNFTTGVSSYPTYTPPATSTVTGATLPAVNFNGGQANYTAGAGGTVFDLVSPNLFTFLLTFQIHTADTTDCYIFTGGNFSFRRLGDGTLKIIVTGASGSNSVEIDSNYLTVTQADGMMTLLFSVDITNNRWRLLKNQVHDGLASMVTWTGEAGRMTTLTANLPSTASTPRANIDIQQFYVTDEFVDTYDSTVLSRVIAQDNKPVDLGSDGHLLTGNVPRMYAKGNAAAWWGGISPGTGIQLGSAGKKLIPNALPTDV